MSEPIDINRVIKGSTCDVTLDSLTKRGVKQVKVVNQATITKLISKTIDTVLSERQQEISAKERERVLEMARTQVDNLARKHREEDQRTIGDLQQANQSLGTELNDLRQRQLSFVEVETERDQARARVAQLEQDNQKYAAEIERLQGEVARLSSADPAQVAQLQQENQNYAAEVQRLQGEVSNLSANQTDATASANANANAVAQLLTLVGAQIQKNQTPQANVDEDVMSALSTLTAKVDKLKLTGGGGGGAQANVPDEVAIDFLISKDDKVETNLNSVEVKQKTAGDVKGALDRLKELQKGGE